jgi:cytochrome o ubiquinol oxidase subunit 2
VQVVALNWKWLFIYPELGVASVNELALPENRPVQFRISSSSVMNSFYVPAMAGQIYAMPGMETKLHGVLNERGNFTGFSANYSGAGFSNMRFAVKSLDPAGFDAWASGARRSGVTLDRAAYLKLERPSEKVPPMRFASVENGLFDRVVNLCVEPGKMCMHDMMAIDAKGGMGRAGLYNVRQLEYDKARARGTATELAAATVGKPYVAELCTNPDMLGKGVASALVRQVDLAPLTGAGLPRPGARRADGPATAQTAAVPLS